MRIEYKLTFDSHPSRFDLEFESLGIKDVVAKSTGTSNPHNMLKATFDAFKKSESPKSVAAKRSKKVNEIVKNKNSKKNSKEV